jgi:O-antigen/teichoic acid export membrane protein
MEPTHGSLLRKTAKGTAWIVAWRMVTRLLGFASTLILVRVLSPGDFGLVALATGFAQAIEGFSWLDVEDAVVREKAPTREVYDTGFTMNVLRGLATGTAIAALAWPAGGFFAEPRVTPVLLVLAAATAADGFLNIGIVDFRRDFAFDREFRLWILPRLAGTLVAITLVLTLATYWALVAGILTTRVLRVAASYLMHPYRPRFGLRAWDILGNYSLWTWALGLLTLLRDRADSLILGRMLGTASVGVFSLATEMAALPTTELVEPMCRAAFSGFAAVRHAELTPAETWQRMIATTAVVTLPAGLGIALVAVPFVALAFGPAWGAAVLPMRVLAVAGTVTVFGYVSATLFRTHGLMANAAGIMAGALLLRVALLIGLTWRWGLPGAAIAVAVAIIVEQGGNVARSCRQFHIPLRRLVGSIWRTLLASLGMAAAVLLAGPVGGPAWLMMAADVGLGVPSYAALLGLLWLASGRPDGPEADMLALARRFRRRDGTA